jgi:hypothetical protein
MVVECEGARIKLPPPLPEKTNAKRREREPLHVSFGHLAVGKRRCEEVHGGLDRHPETSLSSLVPSLSCRRCPNSKRMPRLVALACEPVRDVGVR